MSKRSTSNKLNNNQNNNSNSNSKSPNNNNQYNVIINQNSTFNQDNSINIMLDGAFPYFQNYNYQSNDADASNQIYPFCQDYSSKIDNNYQTDSNKKQSINNSNKKSNLMDNILDSPKNIKNISKTNSKKKEKCPIVKKPKDDQSNQRSTNKIDYRYIKKCPIKEIISSYKNKESDTNIKEKENQQFWFATYGKLMKTKHLIKILNYYNNNPLEPSKNIYSNINLKEKTLIIRDFDIYFYENSNKPFIKYSKGGTIYTKLYLLTLKEISLIFSYINRVEYNINYDILNYLQRKGTFKIINNNSNGIILPYCLIYCLGKYMNINIYSFSNNIDFSIYLDEISFEKNQRISSYTVINNNNNMFNKDNHHNNMNNTNIKSINYKLPSSKKIAKLIKIINLNFPDLSIEEIINYLIPDNKYLNSITKITEIKNIFFFKQQNLNKIILSSMVRDTIKGISIQTPKSLFSSFCPAESILDNNSFKNSDLFQPVTNKKYAIPIKDDYKFQTISTTEKDNNKNNPFIIYISDNIQKINFTDNQNQDVNNNNQTNIINQNINNNNEIKNNNQNINNNNEINNYNQNTNNNVQTIINNNQNINNNTIKKKKHKHNNNNNNNEATNKKDTNIQYSKTENNLQNKRNDNKNKVIKNQIINISDSNQINNNKTQKIPKEKQNVKKKSIDANIKQNKLKNNTNNVFMSGNKKKIKIQRVSTDVREKINNGKYNSLTGFRNCRNKIRESNAISHANIILDNNKSSIRKLNKSIESHNNFSAKFRLSKMSEISQIGKTKSKNSNINNNNNNNNTLLLKRVNMNKKENNNNPFFVSK